MKTYTQQDVRHVAQLARLEITDEELPKYVDHFNRIISYVSLLEECETSNTAPLFSAVFDRLELFKKQDQLHADNTIPSLSPEAILKNAPEKFQNQFSVNAVIDEAE